MDLKSLVTLVALALLSVSTPAQHGPYAGEQQRAIKSLSEKDIADLQAGQGMGLAKAAELNGYPGPAHVLEHADALRLTAAQREQSKALLDSHKAAARELGRQLVEAERALDMAFASKRIDPSSLTVMTAEIGQRAAKLREEHLRTHLAQAALLDAAQIRRYAQLRGYESPAGTDAKPARVHSGH
jgi:Spy/CpxP family protein refolding chaperone